MERSRCHGFFCFSPACRNRLGDRAQIHRWFLETGADGPHRRLDGRQPCLAWPGAEGASRRHRLCGVDRHRHVGTALLGIWLLGEPATAIRLACIALIVCGSWAEVRGLNACRPKVRSGFGQRLRKHVQGRCKATLIQYSNLAAPKRLAGGEAWRRSAGTLFARCIACVAFRLTFGFVARKRAMRSFSSASRTLLQPARPLRRRCVPPQRLPRARLLDRLACQLFLLQLCLLGLADFAGLENRLAFGLSCQHCGIVCRRL